MQSENMQGVKGYIMAACDDKTDQAIYNIKVLKTTGGHCVVQYDNKETEEVLVDDLIPLDKISESGASDLIRISYLNEASVLINLKARFSARKVCTWIKDYLLFVNPYQKTPGSINPNKKYSGFQKTAQTAYENLEFSNQSIILIGESGSGKTKATKNIIKYLSMHSDTKIISALHIFQAFGSAGTSITPTSTRWASYISIYFESKVACGAKFEIISIDKSRVVQRHPNQKNFKVFYLLKSHSEDDLIEQLGVRLEKYRYIGVDYDSSHTKAYHKVCKGLEDLGMREEKTIIFRVIAGILSIGNIDFQEEDETVNITQSSCKYLRKASKLLSLKKICLKNTLTKCTRNIGSTQIVSELDLNECISQRDTLAMHLYQKLFDWVCVVINSKLSPNCFDNYIGILDMFGFQSLENNSLEEMFMNYANETVYQFVVDRKFCKEAGPDTKIQFKDNKTVVELFENKKNGIFKLIDECSLAKNNCALIDLLKKNYSSHKVIEIDNKTENWFSVSHTFAQVKYFIPGLMRKNIDQLGISIENISNGCKNDLLKAVLSGLSSNNKFSTSKFIKDIKSLIEKLNKTDCNYIYCFKSNHHNKPFQINQRLLLSQIQQFNVLDLIVLYRKSNVKCIKLKDFMTKYKILFSNQQNPIKLLEKYSKTSKSNTKPFEIIKNSICISQDLEKTLDRLNINKIEGFKIAIIKIQRWMKKTIKRLKLKKIVFIIVNRSIFIAKQTFEALKQVKSIRKSHKNFEFNSYNQPNPLNTPVNLIISAWKVFESRIKLKSLQKLPNQAKKTPNKAIIVIQKAFRGFLCRKSSQLMLRNSQKALTTIQKSLKNSLMKVALIKIKRYSSKLESIQRLNSYNNKESLKAISLIQKRTRVFLLRVHQIKSNLSEFLIKENSLFENLRILEHSNIFSNINTVLNYEDTRLKVLSHITNSNSKLLKSQLTSSGSLAIQTKEINPFHIEKMYFLSRVIGLEVLVDQSIVYDPLWSSQLEALNKECIQNEEQIMDIKIGSCHSIAITTRGKVFVWGWNDKNQCGSYGKKARLVEKVKDSRIIEADCGDDHTVLLNSEGDVYTFGDNSKGQLGQGHYQQVPGVCKVAIPAAKQVCAVGEQSFAVTESGEVYIWPYKTSVMNQSTPFKLQLDISVNEVSAGYNFFMILSTSGLLFSTGINGQGQLGLGDTIDRSQLILISSLKKQGEKISGISCGFSHSIAKSTLGKVFTWGSGCKGQLGNGSLDNELLPLNIPLKTKMKCVQVSAGYSISLIMFENRKILTTGIYSQVFIEKIISVQIPEFFKKDEFALVRISSSWSRLISVTIGILADLRYLHSSHIKLQMGLNSLASKWTSKIDPPVVEMISCYYPAISCRK
jgi:myosin V